MEPDSVTGVGPGEKVHVITRRLFDGDVRRHFAGECTKVAGNTMRVEGYAFVFDATKNAYERRPDKRTCVFSLSDGNLIITVLPSEVEIESLQYVVVNNRLLVTDGKSLSLDINEFGVRS